MRVALPGAVDTGVGARCVADTPVLTFCWDTAAPRPPPTPFPLGHLTLEGSRSLTDASVLTPQPKGKLSQAASLLADTELLPLQFLACVFASQEAPAHLPPSGFPHDRETPVFGSRDKG